MDELRAGLALRWSALVAASPQVLRARDGLQLHGVIPHVPPLQNLVLSAT